MRSESTDSKDVEPSIAEMTQLGSLSNLRGGLVERMAARAGFNAPRLNTENIRSADLSLNPEIQSPYLTIPPGLSPTTLLDSPVFLSNALAQPSPTTGKFLFATSSTYTLIPEAPDKTKDDIVEDTNASSFAFKPHTDSGSSFFFGSVSKQYFPCIDVSVQYHGGPETVQFQSMNTNVTVQEEFSGLSTAKDNGDNTETTDQRFFDNAGRSSDHSSPLDEQQDEGNLRGSGDAVLCISGGVPSEDVYNWRKYGQKQVKGSEYPRSYYKCTHPNCQVKKKVERSHEGHITEIIYKGAHNHPKPPPNRRSPIASSSPVVDLQLESLDQNGSQTNADNDPVRGSAQKGGAGGTSDWRHGGVEMTSPSLSQEYGNQSTVSQALNANHFESREAVDASSTFSNDEDEDDGGTRGSVSLGYDAEDDELESKRRKIETCASEMSGATRAIREPRVVVQTTSEVDILDDGYRWRKYGQKVVKGNPNPRSYYKCTNAGCTVRKHVERASHDLKSVITTYEGKHNHDVPAARNSSHANSSSIPSQATAVQAHGYMPESSQVRNIDRVERPASVGWLCLPGRLQVAPSPGFSFAMNQPGFANLDMAGLGSGQGKFPLHPFMSPVRPVNDTSFLLPKGELKVEALLDSGMNSSANPSLYQQLMSRLPLGPQM